MPVSIVVFGEHTKAGKRMPEKIKDMQDDYCVIDIRKRFTRNKAAFRMPPNVNSTFAPYQLGVAMDGTQFVECVKDVARQIATQHGKRDDTSPIVFAMKCDDGRFDSDAVARCVVDRVLNVSFDEKRLFNANVFSMDCAMSDLAVDTIVDQAWRWASGPWCDNPNTSKWGDEAAIGNSTILEMITAIDEFASEFWANVLDGDFGHQAWSTDDRDDEYSEADENDLGPRILSAVRSTIAADDRTQQAKDVESRKRPKCRVCGGEKRIPEFADIDLDYWMAILAEQTVDYEARKVWKELFQYDQRGQQEALIILNLVITNLQRAVQMDNVSALVMSSTKRALSKVGAR